MAMTLHILDGLPGKQRLRQEHGFQRFLWKLIPELNEQGRPNRGESNTPSMAGITAVRNGGEAPWRPLRGTECLWRFLSGGQGALVCIQELLCQPSLLGAPAPSAPPCLPAALQARQAGAAAQKTPRNKSEGHLLPFWWQAVRRRPQLQLK